MLSRHRGAGRRGGVGAGQEYGREPRLMAGPLGTSLDFLSLLFGCAELEDS